MKKQQFKTSINAARNIVWHALWNEKNYREWTRAFTEDSHAVSEWKEGSSIQFLDGKGSGMYSIIEKMQDPSFMAFKHLGEIHDNEKKPESSWAGSMETYTLTENNGQTELVVEMDVEESHLDYFLKTWPVALEKLKELAESADIKTITVEAVVKSPVNKVWESWTKPEHITKWNHASDDWHSPWAKTDFREGGTFMARMEARDGSMGFDFGGVYNVIRPNEYIEYTIGDGRKVQVAFSGDENNTKVIEKFEAETTHPVEFQRGGWQAILDNFKKYTESN